MNDINEFANMIKDQIIDHLPGEYAGATVNITTTKKVNKDSTSMSVVPTWAEDTLIPTIHLNRSYEAYKNGKPFEDLIEDVANIIKESFDSVRSRPANIDIAHMPQDKVFFQLINSHIQMFFIWSGYPMGMNSIYCLIHDV